MKRIDITNKRFGFQTAIKPVGKNKWRNVLWLCKCDCGKEHEVSQSKLVQGKSKSCGCYALKLHVQQLEKHGITTGGKPRTFTIWVGMKARCMKPTNVSYKSYGARGITVCQEWLVFENFHKWAIENGYEDGKTIDRIDNDGNYSPDNCRWIDRAENLLRQRRYNLLTVNGETLPLSTFARKLGVSRSTLTKYFKRFGKTETEAEIARLAKNQRDDYFEL